MSASIRYFCQPLFAALLLLGLSAAARAEMFFGEADAWPGVAYRATGYTDIRPMFTRRARERDMAPRIASVAVDGRGQLYFCSGVDGYIIRLSEEGEEVVLRRDDQIRQIAIDGDRLYFSVVATPTDTTPYRDGCVYYMNLRTREVTAWQNIQTEYLRGWWWGELAVRNRVIHIAVSDDRGATIYKLGRGYEEVASVEQRVAGLSVQEGGVFFVAGGEDVYQIRNDAAQVVARYRGRKLSSIAFPLRNEMRGAGGGSSETPRIAGAFERTETTVRLTNGSITGRLLNPGSGPRGTAILYGPDDSVAGTALLAADGAFAFRGLAPGRYTVTIEFRQDWARRLIPGTLTVQSDGRSDREVTFNLR
jgi:hypothetical protein